jgi:hypothetical protein
MVVQEHGELLQVHQFLILLFVGYHRIEEKMNNKEISIYEKILDKFDLENPKTFIQHRNLNEFKNFQIERVNPTHRIILYGMLKNNSIKRNVSKTLIKVGEILLISGALLCDFNLILSNIDLIALIFSMFFLDCFLFYLFGNTNILRGIYDYRNRRISW